jgi:hypothetical protein
MDNWVFKDLTHLLPTQTHPFDTPRACLPEMQKIILATNHNKTDWLIISKPIYSLFQLQQSNKSNLIPKKKEKKEGTT